MRSPETPGNRRVGLVLGGGGLKGFAHIGVLRALEERGIVPHVYAGTSIGALIAAAHIGGAAVDELATRAEALRKRDLFRINHMGMLLERMRSPSIYLEEPLRALVAGAVPDVTFSELPKRLLVNTVDLDRGARVVWGLPGLEGVSVRDAIYASCALPGFFPPGRVAERMCIDGGVVDNLPVSVAANFADLLIAVDVGSSDQSRADAASSGFAGTYMRAATMMMHALQQFPLQHWHGPPMVLIRPRVDDANWLSFTDTAANIAEGYRSASRALERFESYWDQPNCVFPRRRVQIDVIRERCTGCGTCVSLAPSIMGLDASGKAFARTHIVEWSPAEGGFVHECPTAAITATNIDRRSTSVDVHTIHDPTPSGGGSGGEAADDEESSAA
ncbi:MAG: patatin-like phospholipase family protein [Gemmatimonadetes bacterium]|nr:patatin-like phospholipase family protein [Gemmatimonadota bacterium]